MIVEIKLKVTRDEVEQYKKDWLECNEGEPELTDEDVMDWVREVFYDDVHDYVYDSEIAEVVIV